jgi:hypothetical protein
MISSASAPTAFTKEISPNPHTHSSISPYKPSTNNHTPITPIQISHPSSHQIITIPNLSLKITPPSILKKLSQYKLSTKIWKKTHSQIKHNFLSMKTRLSFKALLLKWPLTDKNFPVSRAPTHTYLCIKSGKTSGQGCAIKVFPERQNNQLNILQRPIQLTCEFDKIARQHKDGPATFIQVDDITKVLPVPFERVLSLEQALQVGG